MALHILLLFQGTTTAASTCFGCLLIWSLLPFLLGLLIGNWIWGHYKRLAEDRESQLIKLKRQITEDEQSRILLQQKVDSANSITNKMKSNLADCTAEKASLYKQLEATKVEEVVVEEVPEEPLALVEEVPVEEVVVEEVIEEVVEEETISPVVAAAPLAAVGAVVASKPKDKEDDYLPCKAYEGHKVNDKKNNIAFFKHENGQYYFVLYNDEGGVRLRSEGFTTAKERDQELSGVVRLRDNADQYKRVSKGKYYMDVLYDENGTEVGRSCLQKVEEPVVEVKVEEPVKVVEVLPVVPTVTKIETKEEPEIVDRQIIRVKRTVNISGLEDLDGIDIASQTKLIHMGFGSMTALAAASQTDLADRFRGSGLNWRYWWMQSKYATSGDWAKYYTLQDNKGEFLEAEPTIIKKEVKVVEEAPKEVKVVKEAPKVVKEEVKVVKEVTSKAPPIIKRAVRVAAPTRTVKSTSSSSYNTYFASTDLQIIEGVGPKIQQILSDAGYGNWGAIAESSYDDLKKVLSNAGPRYRIHDPRSWARQAQLATSGKWDDLIAYQSF